MISVKGASFGRFGGWRRRYPGGSECRSIFLTVSRAMPNRLAASRWLRPSTWQASRTRRYRSTVYILPPSISKKIEGYRWQSFTPPAAGKSRRFRGLICHRRSQACCPHFILDAPEPVMSANPIALRSARGKQRASRPRGFDARSWIMSGRFGGKWSALHPTSTSFGESPFVAFLARMYGPAACRKRESAGFRKSLLCIRPI